MIEISALLLAAGVGVRLKPLTEHWPKCLMPVSSRPLLEHWLCTLYQHNIQEVLVNVHHHRQAVDEFLARQRFKGWVSSVYEHELLGTAGTLLETWRKYEQRTMLLIHADNWCQCDFSEFLNFHMHRRPENTVMTMMTFRTETPETCGIVELDDAGIVHEIYEKVSDSPGNLANGAVYLLESEVLKWLMSNPSKKDFSTEVLPEFMGRIATWENLGIHRDIGTISSLVAAQLDSVPHLCWEEFDDWQHGFMSNPIHGMLS